MATPDYCFVQLTAAGLAMAKGNPLRVTGRTTVVFTPGQTTRVANYEWDMMLKGYHTPDGSTWFELAPDQNPPKPTPTGKPIPTPAATKETT